MDAQQWKESLRESATTFVQADDALKKAGKELKPVRKSMKEHRDIVLDLLVRQNQAFCNLPEHGTRLKVAARKGKKAPSKDTVRERCLQWEVRAGKSDKSGDDLFAFIFRPEAAESTTLRRVKIPEKDMEDMRQDVEDDAQDDDEEDAEDDD